MRTLVPMLVAVTLLGATGCSAGSDDGGGEAGAKDVCQQFVGKRLKSPGSADFSGETVTENTDGSWTVSGDVDSQNSFGGLVRNSYTCKVRHTSGADWRLVDLQSTGN
ncbi:hypothetical protein [Nocardioides sp. T2.26MG-1]|uniref:hypothetical protein n=1 Tax=Nocardioides sp. T2.26MG-1 TaxID=3041166 RepID=UPI0025401ABC|nr:hypothetical protein [Nocardioides sp. T2.26MG-1]